jgi:hypothetical protein
VNLIGTPCVPRFVVFRTLPGVLFGRLLGYLYTWILERERKVIFSYCSSFLCVIFHNPRKKQGETPAGPGAREGHAHQARIPASYQTKRVFTYSERPNATSIVPMGSLLCTFRGSDYYNRKEVIRNFMMTLLSILGSVVNWYPRNQLMRPFGKGRITANCGHEEVSLGNPVSVLYTRSCL